MAESLHILYDEYRKLKLWDQSYKGTVSPKEDCSLTYALDFRVSILGQYSVGIKETQLALKVCPTALLVKLAAFFEIQFYMAYSRILLNAIFMLN